MNSFDMQGKKEAADRVRASAIEPSTEALA
jgi:hypothetical protein